MALALPKFLNTGTAVSLSCCFFTHPGVYIHLLTYSPVLANQSSGYIGFLMLLILSYCNPSCRHCLQASPSQSRTLSLVMEVDVVHMIPPQYMVQAVLNTTCSNLSCHPTRWQGT